MKTVSSIFKTNLLGRLHNLLKDGSLTRQDVFSIHSLVDSISTERFREAQASNEIHSHAHTSSLVKEGAIDDQTTRLSVWPAKRRGTLLLDQIFSIPCYHYRASELKILIIGPRNEIEFFHALSKGCQPDNVRCIDLTSYSPHVDVMDAHSIQFPLDTFDICIIGWVLPYSNNYF